MHVRIAGNVDGGRLRARGQAYVQASPRTSSRPPHGPSAPTGIPDNARPSQLLDAHRVLAARHAMAPSSPTARIGPDSSASVAPTHKATPASFHLSTCHTCHAHRPGNGLVRKILVKPPCQCFRVNPNGIFVGWRARAFCDVRACSRVISAHVGASPGRRCRPRPGCSSPEGGERDWVNAEW